MSIDLYKDTFFWIAGTIIAVIIALGVFIGPIIAQRRQESIRKREEKLRTHFEDLKAEIIEPIISVTYDLRNQDEKILYENYPITVDHPLVIPNYEFEQQNLFESFSLHFPLVVAEWKELKKKARDHDEKIKDLATMENQQELVDEAQELVKDFKDFSLRLQDNIDIISKYELGKTFKKHQNCPVCNKF